MLQKLYLKRKNELEAYTLTCESIPSESLPKAYSKWIQIKNPATTSNDRIHQNPEKSTKKMQKIEDIEMVDVSGNGILANGYDFRKIVNGLSTQVGKVQCFYSSYNQSELDFMPIFIFDQENKLRFFHPNTRSFTAELNLTSNPNFQVCLLESVSDEFNRETLFKVFWKETFAKVFAGKKNLIIECSKKEQIPLLKILRSALPTSEIWLQINKSTTFGVHEKKLLKFLAKALNFKTHSFPKDETFMLPDQLPI